MRFRWYLCSALCSIFLLTGALFISSALAQQDNTSSATRSSSMRRSSNSNRRRRARRRRSGQVAKARCTNTPPTNPSNCNISQRFQVGCNLPFDGSASHEIDERCPNEGCASRASDKAQNRIKNNYCATGTPVQISFATIDRLQRAVDRIVQQGQISYGTGGPPQPDDRVKLQRLSTVDANGNAVTLGEGSVVTLEAFVLDAKHDDTFPFGFGGESVNCKNSLLEWNDIHIALGQTARARECSSVTAEIIPHFRPALWDRFDSNACTSPLVANPLPVKGLRVRITGQLFFDGSHKPSPCSAPAGGGNPLRRAVWEIHPVYRIEVFNGSSFISLEAWAAARP